MKSRKQPYGDPGKHAKLMRLLPLTTPLSLMIDPANICNFHCTFCPTAYPELLASVARPRGVMKYELFCKIIDDCKAFPNPLGKLHLYKDGEPFLNKHLGKMIAYAKRSGVAKSIETTTNGSLLNLETSKKIIDAGLDRIRISIEHVHDRGYKLITGNFSDYSSILSNVERLYYEKQKRKSKLHIHVKLVDVGFTDEEKIKFFTDFDGLADEIFIDELMGWSDSGRFDFTLGRSPEVGMSRRTQINRYRIVCPQPFYTLSVNFNGLVSVCCVDWTMNTVVGDCGIEELPAIWNGVKLKRFRLMHLEGNRKANSACRNCQYLSGMSEASDLDDSRKDLLNIFQ